MTLATTAADLLPAICDPENFGDDALRLAYADLLEEEGEADRAEFVRVQVDAEGVRAKLIREEEAGRNVGTHARECCLCYVCGCWRRLNALRRREGELQAPGRRWWSDYGPGDRVTVREWRRGFARSVALACAGWLAHGPALVRAQPVEVVRLTDKGPTEYAPGGGPSYWRWFDGSRGSGRRYEDAPAGMTADELPGRLWEAYRRLAAARGLTWEHPAGAAAALDALSEVCLSWARSTGPTP
jgi:uncharacterized protein (TIGR02996 family)